MKNAMSDPQPPEVTLDLNREQFRISEEFLAKVLSQDSPSYAARPALGPEARKILAEVGFLLLVFGGIWLAAAQIAFFKMATGRTIVAGVAFTASGVLLIIATRWGHFG